MTATRHDVVRTEPKSLELREEHLALAPVMDMKAAKTALDELAKFVREQLVEGTGPDADYGKIPGTNKPSLYQPGAQKIAFYFGLTPIPKLEREIMTAEFCSKTYTITMVDRRSGREIAGCSGSCNSTESRFFKKGKATYVDARETENTCDKMAQKRALVGATIIATRAAGLFTQDVEDLPKAALGQEEEERDERPRQERPRAADEKVETLEQAIAFKLPWKKHAKYGTPLVQLSSENLMRAVDWCNDVRKKAEAKGEAVGPMVTNLQLAAELVLTARGTGELEEPPDEREDPQQGKIFDPVTGEVEPDPTPTPAASSAPTTGSAPASDESSSSDTAAALSTKTKTPGESAPTSGGESLPDPADKVFVDRHGKAHELEHPLKFKPNTTPEGVLALEALENTDPDEASVYDLSRIIKDAINKGPFDERERSSLMSLYAGSGNNPKKLRTVKKGVLATARNLPF